MPQLSLLNMAVCIINDHKCIRKPFSWTYLVPGFLNAKLLQKTHLQHNLYDPTEAMQVYWETFFWVSLSGLKETII